MGFLWYAIGKFFKLILTCVVIALLILGYKWLDEHAHWINYVILGLVFAYIFLRCWYEEYEKVVAKKKQEAARKEREIRDSASSHIDAELERQERK